MTMTMKVYRFLLLAMLALPTVASAQPAVRAPRAPDMFIDVASVSTMQVPPIVNPNGVKFPASPDDAVVENGVRVVTGYKLDLSNTTTPTVVTKTVDVGQPALVAGQVVFSQLAAVRATLPVGNYTAVAYAEGPGGRTVMSVISDPFTVAARVATAPGKPVWIQ